MYAVVKTKIVKVGKSLGICISLIIVLLTASCGSPPVVKRPGVAASINRQIFPDTEVQHLASTIVRRNVAFIHFDGMHFDTYESEQIDVRDPKLVDRFLSALRHATVGPNGRHSPLDTLEIHFLAQHGKRREPIAFGFHPYRSEYSFGDEFHEALHALEQDQAGKLRQAIHSRAGKTRSVALGGSIVLTKPIEIQRLLNALQSHDQPVCMYTDGGPGFIVAMSLINGQVFRFRYIISGDTSVKADSNAALLQDYYKKLLPPGARNLLR